MSFYSIESVQDGIVRLESDDGKTEYYPVSLFPDNIKEGSVVKRDGDVFSVDEEQTAVRRGLSVSLIKKLQDKGNGKMNVKDILSKVDHTLLAPDAVWEDIMQICDDGIAYGVASVCIPPSFVHRAKEYVGDRLRICTVIGFPLGYSTSAVKCFEAADAVDNGADEIDMVINIGMLKARKYDEVLNEINAVKKSCEGRLLKVIIETCLLTEEEKIKMCDIVSASDADFIKTSTGFSKGGATGEDIKLFACHIKNGKKIKAAGGISSLADAEDFISLGADRLGTSRVVKAVKNGDT